MAQHKELTEYFNVKELDIHYEKHESDDESPDWWELFIGEYRVGTGLSRESVTKDALKNGKYAIDKQIAIAKQEALLNDPS